jgi:hypothetical protein
MGLSVGSVLTASRDVILLTPPRPAVKRLRDMVYENSGGWDRTTDTRLMKPLL